MQAVELISITRYRPPGGVTDPPPTVVMIDPLDFPLWQWFVYAACAIIVTTATTLLICAVSFTPHTLIINSDTPKDCHKKLILLIVSIIKFRSIFKITP
jgi:hypothetical protein